MKKGFTLIELLAVIIVLGLLAILVAPSVINQLTRINEDKTSSVMSEILSSAAQLYMDNHQDKYTMTNGDKYCIKIETLVNEGFLTEPVLNPVTGDEYSKDDFIQVDVASSIDFVYSITNTCSEIIQ